LTLSLVETESEEELRALNPEHTTLRKIPVRGVTVMQAVLLA
jgi:hypothetical protein